MTGAVAAATLLAIDTATTRIVVATGSMDGQLGIASVWPAGYRHGETLLPTIERTLADAGRSTADLTGIVVGTGPGAFTGLRVGLATAKGLAHGLGVPIVGVSTGVTLLVAAASVADRPLAHGVLLLRAGPSDRLVIRAGGPPVLLPGGDDPELAPDDWLVAIDLEERAPVDALTLGERARDGLAATLLAEGARRLAAGDADDLARLVPEYVTLPRGAAPPSGEVTWSRDPR